MEIMVIMEVIESKVFFHNVFKNYLFRKKKKSVDEIPGDRVKNTSKSRGYAKN